MGEVPSTSTITGMLEADGFQEPVAGFSDLGFRMLLTGSRDLESRAMLGVTTLIDLKLDKESYQC